MLNDTHMKNCVLLNSEKQFIKIEYCLLLTSFTCLQNHQLSSIHSIVTYQRVQMFEKGDSSIKQKMKCCSFW